ncbi:MAG: hypothetical protein ABL998_15675 [Planctomycetota bacterium]
MRKKEPLGSPWRTREDSSLFLATMLRLVAPLERPLGAAGVDYALFRELLRTRIVLDLRPAEASGNAFGVVGSVLAVLMSWALGLLVGLISLSGNTQAWVVTSLSALLFILVLILLQSLAGMLMDPVDVRVLARHPVPDRTLFAVRLVQVFAYLALQSAGFLAGNLMVAWIKNPVVPVLLVYPLLVLATTLTALGGIALLVAGLLRLVGPGHFQRVVLWMQVFVGGAAAASAQILPRLIGMERLRAMWETDSPWKFLWPPFAYAEVFASASGEGRAGALALAVTVLVPLAALLLTLRLASRHYVAGLEGGDAPKAGAPIWTSDFFARLAPHVTRGREQRLGFEFACALGRREGHVLKGVLPQMLSMQAMVLAMMLRERDEDTSFFLSFSAGMLVLSLPNLLELTQGTSQPEARWLFQASPLEDEDELMRGALKGLLVSWWGLAMLVAGGVQLALLGFAAWLEALLAFELAAVLGLFYARIWAFGVPFRRAVRANQFANMGLMMSMMLALLLLGATHFGLSYWRPVEIAALVALPFVLAWQWGALDRKQIGKGDRLSTYLAVERDP